VMRRRSMGSIPDLVATLSEANLNHIVSPELWVPALCGGGHFLLGVYHATDLGKQIGGFINFSVTQQEARDVDASVLKKSDWRGPTTLDFPQPAAPRPQDPSPMYNVTPPSGPGPSNSATSNPPAWARQPEGGSVHREHYDDRTWSRHQASQAALEAERRNIENERLSMEKEKHKQELEALKKAHDADMKAMKAEIFAQMSANKPTGPDQSAQMLQEIMKQAAEDRRAAENRAAEDRRAAREAQERADARMLQLLEKMNDKPKENPLEVVKSVAEILGKNGKGNDNEAQMKMMHTMAESMSTLNSMAMDFAATAAEMQLGASNDKESPIVKGIQAAMKGLGALSKASAGRPMLPPAQPLPRPPTFEQAAQQPPPPQAPQQAPQQPPRPPVQKSAIDQIQDAIRAKFPVAQVANALIQYFMDPSIQQALLEANGDIEALIEKRLGAWSRENPSNAAYITALQKEIETQAIAAGLLDDDSQGEGGDEDEVEEGDDE